MFANICEPARKLVSKEFFKIINISNKNIIMSSFKSSRDIQKKEGGPEMAILKFQQLCLRIC